MTEKKMLEKALETLKIYVAELSLKAGEDSAYAEELWERIRASEGVLQELAYYHDYGNFLCRYKVAGCTLADILVWQVDHFKAYLDRPLEMNRYRKEKLLLTAFDILLQMEKNSEPWLEKMRSETGTDFVGKF